MSKKEKIKNFFKLPKNAYSIIFLITMAVFILSFCTGCGHLQMNQRESQIGGGFATGVAATKITDKMRKAITADINYPNIVVEMCLPYVESDPDKWQTLEEDEEFNFGSMMRAFGGRVKCIGGPCDTDRSVCERDEPWEDYAARNGGRFTSIEVNLTNFDNHLASCKAAPNSCYDIMMMYEGESILFTKKEEKFIP